MAIRPTQNKLLSPAPACPPARKARSARDCESLDLAKAETWEPGPTPGDPVEQPPRSVSTGFSTGPYRHPPEVRQS